MTLERGTHIEVNPEPTPEARAAILAALEQIGAQQQRGPGRWWEVGLRESVFDEPEDEE